MLISRIFSGDTRTALIKKNVAGSFLIKGWSCLIQFLLVPIILKCLNQYEYGVWLTINSILVWIDYFDIGLGNGLRNKLAEALALGDKKRAQKLTSTTFLMLIIITVPLVALFMLVITVTDCYSFFNVSSVLIPNLKGVLYVSVALVGGTFIFKFISNIYLGLQLPAISNFLLAAGRTLSLIGIAALALVNDHSLLHVAFIYTLTPLVIYLISYPITFHYYPHLRPALQLYDHAELHELFSLGVKFFLVQIGGAILFATSNLLISHLVSPSEVTPYQLSYYYFNIPLIIFTIISTPLWTATTDAHTKGEWKWIKDMEHKMHLILAFMLLMIIVMIFISPIVYQLWIDNKVIIDIRLSIFMGIYVSVLIFSLCYSNILNGIGKIWLLTLLTLIEAIAFLPLAYLLGHKFGVLGIIEALIIVNLLCATSNYIQFKKLAKGTAKGVWDR